MFDSFGQDSSTTLIESGKETLIARSAVRKVVLRIFQAHPEGLFPQEFYRIVRERFELHPCWRVPFSKVGSETIHDIFGVWDYHVIPEDELMEKVATEPRIENTIRFIISELRKAGKIETADISRGFWKPTDTFNEIGHDLDFTEEEEKLLINKEKLRQTLLDEIMNTAKEFSVRKLRTLLAFAKSQA